MEKKKNRRRGSPHGASTAVGYCPLRGEGRGGGGCLLAKAKAARVLPILSAAAASPPEPVEREGRLADEQVAHDFAKRGPVVVHQRRPRPFRGRHEVAKGPRRVGRPRDEAGTAGVRSVARPRSQGRRLGQRQGRRGRRRGAPRPRDCHLGADPAPRQPVDLCLNVVVNVPEQGVPEAASEGQVRLLLGPYQDVLYLGEELLSCLKR